MKPFTIGDLRERITIQLPTVAGTEAPGTPTVLASVVPAEIVAEGSRQGVGSDQLGGSLTYRVRTWNLTGVTAKHELIWGTRTLRIVGGPWDPDGSHRWLMMRVVETT